MKADRAREIRQAKGLTVTQMAMVLNLSEPDTNGADRVREMERGVRPISGPVERLLQLVEADMVPVRLLLD